MRLNQVAPEPGGGGGGGADLSVDQDKLGAIGSAAYALHGRLVKDGNHARTSTTEAGTALAGHGFLTGSALTTVQETWSSQLNTLLDACADISNHLDYSAASHAEEAQRAVGLAKKGRGISHEELMRLNELLKDDSGSEEFSRTFCDGMGPKGALEFFGRLPTDAYDYTKVDKQRPSGVQELQKNMGLSLATATQGGDAWTDKWSTEMRKLGTERIPLAKYDNNPAFDCQLLGGIMRYGDYDKNFLVPIAEHVTQLHAKDPYLFANSKPLIGGGLWNQYNPSGVNGSGFDPMTSMPDALGHALEAATLGHAWDDPTPELKRDETTATIMKDAVAKYGEDAELLKKWRPTMADSLGNMGAGYIDDLNWALDKNTPDSAFRPTKETAAHPVFGQDETIRFLSTLGRHPDAYATVSTAERLYATSVLEAQVGPDGRIDEGHARGAVFTGATLQGLLGQSRGDQVEAEGMKKHEEYEKAQAAKAGWVEFGATVGIAAGVAFLPATAAVGAAAVLVPLAVDSGSGAMEQLAGQVIGDWSDQSTEDHKDKTFAEKKWRGEQ
ncbi:hypothetical protein [Streptomyces sp. TLI_105]|uniref:hypothetical protein n=1 Tax=Streptomyces sp. TLI_105 TaxID=1881019 RepID=UPI0008992101|nr:hypothetical protein [Streptomyces sp. TLI_105]SED27574.1 hypothetical protein SAMN05428939_4738 [Streptomyces sp. TLI_105]